MPRLILFNKPFNVLCQFRDQDGRAVLADYISLPGVYPAGRLDQDSEGLLLLTDDGGLQARISAPRWKLPKTYWVQVEGEVSTEALQKLRSGVLLRDGPTLPVEAEAIAAPDLWERHPPIRYRASIPTSWITLTIREGRNRQVRRMTAAVGFPTLRLVRVAIGPWRVAGLAPGEWKEVELTTAEIDSLFGSLAKATPRQIDRRPQGQASAAKARRPPKAGSSPAGNGGGTSTRKPKEPHPSDSRPQRRSSSPPPNAPRRAPTPSSRKGRGS